MFNCFVIFISYPEFPKDIFWPISKKFILKHEWVHMVQDKVRLRNHIKTNLGDDLGVARQGHTEA